MSSQTVLQLLQPDLKLSDVFAIFPFPIVKGVGGKGKCGRDLRWCPMKSIVGFSQWLRMVMVMMWMEMVMVIGMLIYDDDDDVDDVLAGGKWLSG